MIRTLLALLLALQGSGIPVAVAGEIPSGRLRVLHDGPASFSKRGLSFSGVGTTEFRGPDFVLSVKGQFRMQGSARLAKPGSRGKDRRIDVIPEWISLVALGHISLKTGGAKGTRINAAKAVYLFAEDRWLLDGKDL